IGDQIAEPLIYHRGMSRTDARKRGAELLRLVGIPSPEERLEAFPHELSGGMRQRVMIAIGLACDPELLIADEPTTALDVTILAQIVDLVDRVVVLYAGTVVEDAPVDDLYAHPLHPYTRGLLASIPKLTDAAASRLSSIGGTPPEPGRRPKGCPFAPRCPLAMPICEAQVPALEAAGGERHRVACFAVDKEKRAAA